MNIYGYNNVNNKKEVVMNENVITKLLGAAFCFSCAAVGLSIGTLYGQRAHQKRIDEFARILQEKLAEKVKDLEDKINNQG